MHAEIITRPIGSNRGSPRRHPPCVKTPRTAWQGRPVDQLEELFTDPAITPAERERFVLLLAGLAHSGVVWVVATMRSDFWHRVAEMPLLAELANARGRLDLWPPSAAELTEIIRRPAAAAGIGPSG